MSDVSDEAMLVGRCSLGRGRDKSLPKGTESGNDGHDKYFDFAPHKFTGLYQYLIKRVVVNNVATLLFSERTTKIM